MIYFIQDQTTLLIKIGFTEGDPTERLQALQTGCPGKLLLVFSFPGDRTEETRWHCVYDASRERGEWFRPTTELIRGIVKRAATIVGESDFRKGYQAGLVEASREELEERREDFTCGKCDGHITPDWADKICQCDWPLPLSSLPLEDRRR